MDSSVVPYRNIPIPGETQSTPLISYLEELKNKDYLQSAEASNQSHYKNHLVQI